MSFIDFIKDLFSNGKITTKITTDKLSKIKGDPTPLEILLTDKNNNPLSLKIITIKINGIPYERKTDINGIARLPINLGAGSYIAFCEFKGDNEYNKSNAYAEVNVSPKIESHDLTMSYKDGSKFIVKLTDASGSPMNGVKSIFTINGVDYERYSDAYGIASLNINLNAGKYPIKVKSIDSIVQNNITINKTPTHMEGININEFYSTKKVYQCAVYDNIGRVNGTVKATINGVTYDLKPDAELLYKLNINLNKGDYEIKSVYNGDINHTDSEIKNTINIKADPANNISQSISTLNCKEPWTQNPVLTAQRPGALGQITPYSCGPHSLMQAFYNLTGLDIAESKIMSWAGTTTSGTGHAGLNTAVAQFNKVYNQNIKIMWKNLSDFGATTAEQFKNLAKLKCEGKFIFFHILYRDQYGHYEAYRTCYGDDQVFDILNSLGNRSGNGYIGYIERRNFATQRRYISGISQPSVAILYK